MAYLSESNVDRSIFDEREELEGTVLRQIVDFQLLDAETGEQMAFEELGEGRKKGTLVGHLVEILPRDMRDYMLSLLVTVSQAPIESKDTRAEEHVYEYGDDSDDDIMDYELERRAMNKEPIRPPPLDRPSVKVGDMIDAFCSKTATWYASKVLSTKDSTDGVLIKVHFMGWNQKFDEWVLRDGPCVAAHGESKFILEDNKKALLKLVPWYDSALLVERVREKFGSFPELRQCLVRVEGIEDFCIDYSYGNPSLWLIAESGIWYRIASSTAPGGIFGMPHPLYHRVFSETSIKFMISAHLAMVLLDMLPANSKAGIQAISYEVTLRSGGAVDELELCYYHEYLVEQLSSLKPQVEKGKFANGIASSEFFQQLKRQGEKFRRDGGIEVKIAKIFKESKDRLKELYSKGFLLQNLFSDQVIAILYQNGADEKTKKGAKVPAEVVPVVKLKPVKIKYPIDDEEFWISQAEANISPIPPPEPDFVLDAEKAKTLGIHPNCVLSSPQEHMGRLLGNWFTTINFRKFFSLPLVSLESFDIMLSNVTTVHPVLRQLHISLLSIILKDRQALPIGEEGRKSFVPPKPPFVAPLKLNVGVDDGDPNTDLGPFSQIYETVSESCEIKELSKFFEKYKDKDAEESKWTSCFVALENILKYDTVDADKIASCLQVGDAWFEVLRVLMAEKSNHCMPEYQDSLAECARVIEIISLLPEALPFRFPVDPQLDNAPGYWDIIKHPMDLDTILKRIKAGWYDEDSDITVENPIEYPAGSSIDFYSDELAMWFPGEVLSNIPIEPEKPSNIRMDVANGATDAVEAETKEEEKDSAPVPPSPTAKLSVKYFIGYDINGESLNRFENVTLPSVKFAPAHSNSATNDRYLHPNKLYEPDELIAPKPTDETKGKGCIGIVQDINRVWENCSTFLGDDSDLAKTGRQLQMLFDAFYGHRILGSVGKSNRPSSSSLLFSLIDIMGNTSYSCLAYAQKLDILDWLVEEVMSTASFRSYVEEIAELRYKTAKIKRSIPSAKSLATAAAFSAAAAEIKEAEIREEAMATAAATAAAAVAIEEETADTGRPKRSLAVKSKLDPVLTLSSSTPAPVVESNDKKEIDAAEAALLARLDEYEGVCLHLQALGRDRDRRSYWAIALSVDWLELTEGSDLPELCAPRIFAEHSVFSYNPTASLLATDEEHLATVSVSTWSSYSTMDDVQALLNWLNEKGNREFALKNSMNDWLESHKYFMLKQRTRVIAEAEVSETTWPDVLLEREPFENFEVYWYSRENSPIALIFDLELNPPYTLGIGVRPFRNFVVVTGYKFDEEGYSAAKSAGVRVGDMIIGTSTSVLHSIPDVQQAVKAAPASKLKESNKTFRIVVLRLQSVAIKGSKEVKEIAIGEKTVFAAFDAQIADDVNDSLRYVESIKSHLVSRKEPPVDLPALNPRRHFFREQRGLPGRLVASVVELLRLSSHAYATNEAWTTKVVDYYKRLFLDFVQLSEEVTKLSPQNLVKSSPKLYSNLHETIKTCLLDMETEFMIGNTILQWTRPTFIRKPSAPNKDISSLQSYEAAVEVDQRYSRMRYRWRKSCSSAKTLSQLAVSTFMLIDTLDTSRFVSSTNVIDRTKCASLVPKTHFSDIPKEGDQVIYYGSGHLEAVLQEDKERKQYKIDSNSFLLNLESYVDEHSQSVPPPMWGGSEPLPGAVLSCVVTDVRFFQCFGGKLSDDHFVMHPFAQIDLHVDSKIYTDASYVGVERSLKNKPEHSRTIVSSINRILGRIVNLLIESPYASPFITLVSKRDFPDYYEEVNQPIDLTTIKRSALIGEYVDAILFESNALPDRFVPVKFLADVKLMRDNCELYCSSRFPDLVPAADALWAMAQRLSTAFFEPAMAMKGPELSENTAISISNASKEWDGQSKITVCVRLVDKNSPVEVLSIAASTNRVVSTIRYLIKHAEYEQALQSAISNLRSGSSFTCDSYAVIRESDALTSRRGEVIDFSGIVNGSFVPWRFLSVDFFDLCSWPDRINLWEAKNLQEKSYSGVEVAAPASNFRAGKRERARMEAETKSLEIPDVPLKRGRGRPRVNYRDVEEGFDGGYARSWGQKQYTST